MVLFVYAYISASSDSISSMRQDYCINNTPGCICSWKSELNMVKSNILNFPVYGCTTWMLTLMFTLLVDGVNMMVGLQYVLPYTPELGVKHWMPPRAVNKYYYHVHRIMLWFSTQTSMILVMPVHSLLILPYIVQIWLWCLCIRGIILLCDA